MPPPVHVIHVEREARQSAAYERARALFPAARVETFDDLGRLRRWAAAALTAREAKRRLILAVNRGPFIRPFPRGRSCGMSTEHYLLHGVGCPLDCDYCFIRGYASCHVPTCFVNVEELARELDRLAASNGHLYIHAGELADPGLFEPITGAAKALDEVLARTSDVTVEYRTKWADVEPFMHLGARNNVVLAWTLTPSRIAERFERGAPPTRERIKAAARAASSGFTVGLRFDPVMHLPGWRQAYDALLDDVFREIPAASMDKAVLGVLRFSAATESRLREKLGLSPLLAGEFILDAEGKRRYPRFLRVALYRYIREGLRARAPGLPVELSMETDAVREACGV